MARMALCATVTMVSSAVAMRPCGKMVTLWICHRYHSCALYTSGCVVTAWAMATPSTAPTQQTWTYWYVHLVIIKDLRAVCVVTRLENILIRHNPP
eukprot:SAG11_NODE_12172_length_717_cov_3.522654_2_plen_96_part_00